MDNISGNIVPLIHLDGNLNSSGDQQTVYRGYSAYEIALQQGFEGSKDEWLRALVGPQGKTGVSVSDVRLNEDFTLTVTLDDGTEFTTDSIKGDKGDKGQKGDKGDKGDTGPQGQVGPQGPKGQKGDTGQRGPRGQIGPRGETGAAFTYDDFTPEQLELLKGPRGQKGQKGQTGPKGDTGQKGEKGDTGPKGDTGQTGPEGKQGPQGPKGNKGDKGDTGATGPQGPQGEKGDTGEQGPQGEKGDKGDKGDTGEVSFADLNSALADKAPVITDTASGAIASFTDGADDLPLKSLVVNINPVQDLHGYDSPYPAGGSVNVWGIAYPVSTEKGATITERADGTFFVSCDVALGRLNYLLNVEPNEKYTIKCEVSDVTGNATQASIVTVYDGEDETATILLNGVSSSASPKNFTPSGDKVYLKFNVTGGNSGGTAVISKPIVIKGAYSAPSLLYAPYENICPISGWTEVNVNHSGADMTNPTTLTIQLGQTVYGGKLDVLSGVLTVDMAMVDLGTLTPYITPAKVFVWHVLTPTNGTILCSNYATAQSRLTPSIMPDKTVCTTNTIGTYYPVALKDTAYADATVEEMQAAMSGVQLVYELAEPLTIQLTPNQINSLYGINNLWADSGDTTAEYRADTKLYIQKKIAEAIASLT